MPNFANAATPILQIQAQFCKPGGLVVESVLSLAVADVTCESSCAVLSGAIKNKTICVLCFLER